MHVARTRDPVAAGVPTTSTGLSSRWRPCRRWARICRRFKLLRVIDGRQPDAHDDCERTARGRTSSRTLGRANVGRVERVTKSLTGRVVSVGENCLTITVRGTFVSDTKSVTNLVDPGAESVRQSPSVTPSVATFLRSSSKATLGDSSSGTTLRARRTPPGPGRGPRPGLLATRDRRFGLRLRWATRSARARASCRPNLVLRRVRRVRGGGEPRVRSAPGAPR